MIFVPGIVVKLFCCCITPIVIVVGGFDIVNGIIPFCFILSSLLTEFLRQFVTGVVRLLEDGFWFD